MNDKHSRFSGRRRGRVTGRSILSSLLLFGAVSFLTVLPAAGDTTGQDSAARPEVADASAMNTVADVHAPVGLNRRETMLASLTIFVLAVFLGFELISKVPPTLHTPLMSGSNAISGITLVGAILVVGMSSSGWLIPLLGSLAVIMATVNAVGGFAVTHRMLAMFRRK